MTAELDLNTIQTKLKSWFLTKLPRADDLSFSPLTKPGAGLSNETFLFDMQWKENGQNKQEKLVVRWSPMRFVLFDKYDMKQQYLIMKHLDDTAVPVPRARWLEDDAGIIGSPFYVVDQVDGWIPPEPSYHVAGPLYDGTPGYRAKIWRESVGILAKIHTLDWQKAGFEFLSVPGSGSDPIDQHIASYERLYRGVKRDPDPTIEKTMSWLKKNSFTPKHVSLCWGDARLGNLIFHEDKVVAVLDWEMAVLGDPETDLAWMTQVDWALGPALGLPRLEGLPTTDEHIAYYETITNRKVENFFYHDVFATWRLAVIFHKLEPILHETGYVPTDFPFNTANLEKLRNLITV